MSLPGRFLDIGGQRVFYHRSGRGSPLVLMHGYLLSHWSWRALIPGLAQDHDVIAIDLPGYGESDRPSPSQFRYDAAGYLEAVIGVLDALGIERASLAGQSLGGAIALYTAARQPDRVDRLLVVAPLVYPFPIPVEGRVVLVPYVGLAAMRAFYTRGTLRRYLRRDMFADPSLATDEMVDYIWERINRPGGFEAAHATARFCADPSPVERALRAVRSPACVVWGEEDRLFPAAHARRLASDLPGADVQLIPGCGHIPSEEKPLELLRIMSTFLAPRWAGISAVPA